MMRPKQLLIASFIVGSLAWAAASIAAGTGSGSSLPSCTQDIWTCGEWSSCNKDNEQSRRCVLTFECKDAETPMPPTKQTCPVRPAPAPAPSPTPTPAPAPTPVAEPTPSPEPSVTTQAPKAPEGCTHDTWVCADWPACDREGMQRRDCKVTMDCATIQTPPPQSERVCPTLQCGNLPTLYERVFCRQQLAPAGLAREYEIEYLPELCRARTDKAARALCIDLYRALQPCWQLAEGAERNACAGRLLKLTSSVGARKTECDEKSEADRPLCMELLRNDVHNMILFRMYDLEERAEALAGRDLPAELIAQFSAIVEEKKIAFDAAKDKAGRRQAILELRAAWQDFVIKAKNYLQ